MYLFMDTETGGLTPKHSLLTASFIVTDKDFNILQVPTYEHGLYLQIKHEQYVLTAGALHVNNINVSEHHKTGVDAVTAVAAFADFVAGAIRVSGKKRLVPAGHNVAFDVQFVREYLCPDAGFWDRAFTYPMFDTAVIARFVHAAGKIDNTFSLATLRQKYLPHVSGDSHNAEIDNLTTIELAKKFLQLVQPVPPNNTQYV
jgi:DNA polymerase III alpha subunit (gram-positive type)